MSGSAKTPYEGDVPTEVTDAVTGKAREGRIACAALRRIAEDHRVAYEVAGAAADRTGIRVRDCDLGCF